MTRPPSLRRTVRVIIGSRGWPFVGSLTTVGVIRLVGLRSDGASGKASGTGRGRPGGWAMGSAGGDGSAG